VTKAVIIRYTDYPFGNCASTVQGALEAAGVPTTMKMEQSFLASADLDDYDVLVLGTGLAKQIQQPDGSYQWLPKLDEAERRGLFSFVKGGKGLVAIHYSGWSLDTESIALIGGAANWHPPICEFTVSVSNEPHPITEGVEDFTTTDEIYMCAWDPSVRVLATTIWADQELPLAWAHTYGQGKVFYTALGHDATSFGKPQVQKLLANAAHWGAPRG